MEQLVQYLVCLLVDKPDQVRVRAVSASYGKVYEVDVAPDELGKVIGRHGRTANALRSVVEAAARKRGEKASVEIAS
ncbi:MAG: KH domain-containing protein [candidate division WS1 bacterium]|nr:KH domain-containing protein [candidate division WS1 bacterium]